MRVARAVAVSVMPVGSVSGNVRIKVICNPELAQNFFGEGSGSLLQELCDGVVQRRYQSVTPQ